MEAYKDYLIILTPPAPIAEQVKRLRKCLNEKKSVPHITIARQVPNDKAKKLWPKFKDGRWNDEFEIKRLTILQRESYGHDKTWKPLTEIPFRGDPAWHVLPDKKVEKEDKNLGNVNQMNLF